MATEVNFDGLVGPTHFYGGLAVGNLASGRHAARPSNPKAAALQGLKKMKRLLDLGLEQAVLPPLARPDLAMLRRLGFSGSDSAVIEAAAHAPALLQACYSASSMWVANAATVSPSTDTPDGRVHFTPANLISQFHRSLECEQTAQLLQRIFHHPGHFCHHPPLPAAAPFGDEGAANHNRLCREYGEPGIAMFVHGDSALRGGRQPLRFPARQGIEASRAVARQHGLNPHRVLLVQQNPDAIDQGVFHNDVIAVADRRMLFCHEQAFVDQSRILDTLYRLMGDELLILQAPAEWISLEDAVNTYLFNSQLLRLPCGGRLLLVPEECRRHDRVWAWLNEQEMFDDIEVMDLRQSMDNGGGPACLRLRVVLSDTELHAMHQGVRLTGHLYSQLVDWVERHYRDRLLPEDLSDPQLMREVHSALEELSRLLALEGFYPFQQS
ncbi:N-succinylarginine dihydrolase [Marinobacterium sediminicola]|uniref:N-succinylarginine dihydrolase n=1 Tax=Marinobacterium sediminicola TaxID=518898 RepID=A0ABY1RXV4_9GAMM|nr:N-succinylarginine dihydrolase [Marinobacterium sediminicola]ULG68572.1 N-succinylarginine dihydrolase [Marinobacterium sediminicola]SMR73090.1 succinylarginine dihydrolase [Marinobacterium sediminicola]